MSLFPLFFLNLFNIMFFHWTWSCQYSALQTTLDPAWLSLVPCHKLCSMPRFYRLSIPQHPRFLRKLSIDCKKVFYTSSIHISCPWNMNYTFPSCCSAVSAMTFYSSPFLVAKLSLYSACLSGGKIAFGRWGSMYFCGICPFYHI